MLKEHWCVHVLIQSRSHSRPRPAISPPPPPTQLSLTNAVGFFFSPQSFFFYMLIGGEAAVSRSPWCEIIQRSMGGFPCEGTSRRDRGGRQTKFRMARTMPKHFQKEFVMTFHFFPLDFEKCLQSFF